MCSPAGRSNSPFLIQRCLVRNCRYFAEPFLHWERHCKLLKYNIGNNIVWWRIKIEIKLRPSFEVLIFLLGFGGNTCNCQQLGRSNTSEFGIPSSGLDFNPSPKTTLAKLSEQDGCACQNTLGYWHRNRMVKFAIGSLGKAGNLLLVVVVPCHTLQYKHHLYSFQELLN